MMHTDIDPKFCLSELLYMLQTAATVVQGQASH